MKRSYLIFVSISHVISHRFICVNSPRSDNIGKRHTHTHTSQISQTHGSTTSLELWQSIATEVVTVYKRLKVIQRRKTRFYPKRYIRLNDERKKIHRCNPWHRIKRIVCYLVYTHTNVVCHNICVSSYHHFLYSHISHISFLFYSNNFSGFFFFWICTWKRKGMDFKQNGLVFVYPFIKRCPDSIVL